MPSPLIMAKVSVTDETGEMFTNVSIRIPRGQSNATISRAGGTALRQRDDVASVELVAKQPKFEWRVTFVDGSVWEVVRPKGGCGCGR